MTGQEITEHTVCIVLVSESLCLFITSGDHEKRMRMENRESKIPRDHPISVLSFFHTNYTLMLELLLSRTDIN